MTELYKRGKETERPQPQSQNAAVTVLLSGPVSVTVTVPGGPGGPRNPFRPYRQKYTRVKNETTPLRYVRALYFPLQCLHKKTEHMNA